MQREPATAPPSAISSVNRADVGAWSPLRHPVYRALFAAQFVSNIGTWMQTVGAQWLMGDLTEGPFAVALVQTAVTLPIFLAVVPAGVLGDLLDRRRLLIVTHGVMCALAVALAVATAAGAVTPPLLLTLVFALGLGQAFVVPSWQAIQPELVDREEIPQAATLHGVSVNLGRAVGPAIGGVLIATTGASVVFAVNAVSFAVSLVALVRWQRPADVRPFGQEPYPQAMRAGAGYVRATPILRVLLARTAAFTLFGSALWALIPVVARDRLDLGATGYGVLLTAVGLGALSGAFVLPGLRARLSVNAVVGTGTALFAAGLALLAATSTLVPALLVLPFVGLAWIAVVSSLNAATQSMLPAWARARGLAYFVLVIMAGQAAGSLLWGVVASRSSVTTSLAVAAAGLALSVLAGRRFPVRWLDVDLSPSQHWPASDLADDVPPGAGPVLVTVAYRVRPGAEEAFRAAMGPVGLVRRRTGAVRWRLEQDPADPSRFVETWRVGSWAEHVRQHGERVTVRDGEWEARATALLADDDAIEVSHVVLGAVRTP